MKDYSIAGIGEVLWDLFPEYKRLGGGTANFAYHVSQFGFDAAVATRWSVRSKTIKWGIFCRR